MFLLYLQVLTLDANKNLSEVINEFKTHEPEIINKIAVKQKNKINSSNGNSPSKVKHLLTGNPEDRNFLLNSTGL